MSKENKSVIGNATAHFKSALSGELKSVEVPEWDTTIYFRTATTFATEKKILDLHSKGETVEALVETLLAKSLDKDGNRVFTNADKIVMMREVDPEVIIRIVGAMQAAKEEAKNSLGN